MTGHDSYEFTHRTFLEYYYAVSISERLETLQEHLDAFKSRILKGQDIVVAHLCLQRYVRGSLDRSNRVSQSLINILKELSPSDRPVSGAIMCDFASEAIDYLAPSESELKHLIETLTLYASDTTQWRAALYRILRRARDQKEAVFAGVIEGLVMASRYGAGRALASVYDYLYAVRLRRQGLVRSNSQLPAAIEELSKAIERIAESEAPVGQQGTAPAALKLKWDCYGLDTSIYDLGLTPWNSSVSLLGRNDWLGVDAAILLLMVSNRTAQKREQALVVGLGRSLLQNPPSLARFGSERRVVLGAVEGLNPQIIENALSAASGEMALGLVACLAIAADYQELANRKGVEGPIRSGQSASYERLISEGIKRAEKLGAHLNDDLKANITINRPRLVSTNPVGQIDLFPWEAPATQG
jgi:hypothetical protein